MGQLGSLFQDQNGASTLTGKNVAGALGGLAKAATPAAAATPAYPTTQSAQVGQPRGGGLDALLQILMKQQQGLQPSVGGRGLLGV